MLTSVCPRKSQFLKLTKGNSRLLKSLGAWEKQMKSIVSWPQDFSQTNFYKQNIRGEKGDKKHKERV